MLRRIIALDVAGATKDQARCVGHGAVGMFEQHLHQPFNEVRRDYIVAGFWHDVVRVTGPESTLKTGDRPTITAVPFDANRGMPRGVIAQQFEGAIGRPIAQRKGDVRPTLRQNTFNRRPTVLTPL